ncbi:hypothetical protein NFI96_005141 [Prochilodus magdalenae]|nr:hypothetical protein NFI96_005141 [Prochilodus magdalenae]
MMQSPQWDDADPPPELLPCVRVVAIRDHGEGSVSAACKLEGSLGMCVTHLDVPLAWFTPPPPRRRSQEPPLPTMELHYSLFGADEQGGECTGGRAQSRVQEVDMQRIGTVTLGSADSKAEGKKLRLDRNVQIVAPSSPVKQGQTVSFQILMDTTATTEQFTLRYVFKNHHVATLTGHFIGNTYRILYLAKFIQTVLLKGST